MSEICKKCKLTCKQSGRVTVVSCALFRKIKADEYYYHNINPINFMKERFIWDAKRGMPVEKSPIDEEFEELLDELA